MATTFGIALAAGLAVASVNAFFAWQDGRSPAALVRTFVGWLLAFLVAGLLAPEVAEWLLRHVF